MHSLLNYADYTRSYHNLLHIGYMLENLDRNFKDVYREEAFQLRLAIVYHDVVYDPKRRDNEFQSALAAREELPLVYEGISEETLDEVSRLIMLTKYHLSAGPDDTLGNIIIDLDLAGMATSQYDSNTERIRQEFDFLSDEEWRKSRVKFLKTYLKRDQIFYTEYGQRNWENPARHNMTWELEGLNNVGT